MFMLNVLKRGQTVCEALISCLTVNLYSGKEFGIQGEAFFVEYIAIDSQLKYFCVWRAVGLFWM